MDRRLAAIFSADVVGYSRLMEEDEAATLAALKSHRKEMIDPAIARHHGRIVKTMGDGALVELASVVDALECALDIQRGMAVRNDGVPADRQIRFRIGIHIGDVIVEGEDIYGDGVNVASRLEGLAEPGTICISQQVLDVLGTKLKCSYRDLGEQRIKNIFKSVHVYRVDPPGDGALELAAIGEAPSSIPEQSIRFCIESDGVGIAYATVGRGPPLVKAANWLSHLEYDWRSPVWRDLMSELARDHQLIRYDARGSGLSDRDVEEISLDAFVRDLETVVDAVGLERFALLGVSQGCAVSVTYAVRHPGRLTHLILYGGYVRGRRKRGSTADREQADALVTLMRHGWGQANPAFRQIFTSLFLPSGTPEQLQWFNDLQRISASPENAARIRACCDDIDVTGLLGQVQVPTLVLHCRGDAIAPFEEGRRFAAMISGARFVALNGENHIILRDDPAWPRFMHEVRDFLAHA